MVFDSAEIVTKDMFAGHAVRSGEIVIEIDNEHLHAVTDWVVDDLAPFDASKLREVRRETIAGNRNELFPPCESRPRGRGEPLTTIRSRDVLMRHGGPRMRHSMDPSLGHIEFIPGERIHLDMNQKIGRISDACFDAEYSDLRTKLYQASRSMEKSSRFLWIPSPAYERKFASDSELWHWIWHMRKICDGDLDHNSGPAAHPGCAFKGPRRCLPVQNIDLLPTEMQCIDSGLIDKELPPMSREELRLYRDELATFDQGNKYNERTHSVRLTRYVAGIRDGVAV